MLSGVGLGLRWEFIHDFVEELPPLPFVEVSPENYIGRGGYYAWALDRVHEHCPLISHGLSLSLAGVDPFDADHVRDLRTFLQARQCAFHSDHLSFGKVNGVALHDLLPSELSIAEAKRVAERICEARDRLEHPLAVENISFYLPPRAGEISEADFIAEVCERADCGLLLDLNNAYVNASNFGTNVDDWLARIPMNRVVQIHVAGHERMEEGGDSLIVDTHGANVIDPVKDLLRRILPLVGRVPVVLERDENVPPLGDLLSEVRDLQAIYDEVHP